MQPDAFRVEPFPNLEALTAARGEGRRLRVCIATEEIVGPIANGGIASTYFDLARLLVAEGHDVTVLYLKGQTCHNETIEHWIDHYAKLGIRFVPLPDLEKEPQSAAPHWQTRLYAAMVWLQNEPPFDVVHTSEWRGGMYYALLAKRQGLAFRDTLFVVKSSSPHIWNRHYQMRFLESAHLLGVLYPEQMTIELADMVIGGSAHLLRFMEHMGYTLPANRTFVQPNVILFDKLNVEDKRPSYEIGDVVKTSELVFFGRLEQRKGLETFCDALDFIVAKGIVPSKVSFLGKEGTRLPSYPHLKTSEVIALRAKNWPCEVAVHLDFNQHAAISYLVETSRIAVMPSLIENSTMAVYEALVYKIPFVAARVGGTPELIAPEYHARVLCGANPRDLAAALERVMTEGQVVAAGAFSNDHNLQTWRNFHNFLAQSISEGSVEQTISKIADAGGARNSQLRGSAPATRLSVCIAHKGDGAALARLLEALQGQAVELCIAVASADLTRYSDLAALIDGARTKGAQIIISSERSLGEVFNELANNAGGDALVFLRSDIHVVRPDFTSALISAFTHSKAEAFSPSYEIVGANGQRRQYLPMGGDLGLGFYDPEALCDVIAIRASTFHELHGFSELFGLGGLPHDLAVRLIEQGGALQALPMVLYEGYEAEDQWRLDYQSGNYLAVSSLVSHAPLYLKKILMGAGLRRRVVGRSSSYKFSSLEEEDGSKIRGLRNWATPEEDEDQLLNIRIGFDEEQQVFGFLVNINAEPLPTLSIEREHGSAIVIPLQRTLAGLHAKWQLDEATINELKPGRLEIKLANAASADNAIRMQRLLSVVSGRGGSIGIKSTKAVEHWPGGEPPAEAARQQRLVWRIESGNRRQRTRLKIGFDANSVTFGIFSTRITGEDTRVTVTRGDDTIATLSTVRHGIGRLAVWRPDPSLWRLLPLGELKFNMESPEQSASLSRTVTILMRRAGILTMQSPAPIENWPDGTPKVMQASTGWKNQSALRDTEGMRPKLRIGFDEDQQVFGFLADVNEEPVPDLSIAFENGSRIQIPMQRTDVGLYAKWAPNETILKATQPGKITIHVMSQENADRLQRVLNLTSERNGLGFKSRRPVEYWPEGEPPSGTRSAARAHMAQTGPATRP